MSLGRNDGGMDFRSRDFLLGHIRHTLAFYDPRALDPSGGFHHCYMNDGTLFDPGLKTLVASARFVFNYAKAYRQFGEAAHREKMIHGLNYLRDAHRHPETGGYAWTIENGRVVDATNHCYGLAFVLLAYACAMEAGFAAARAWIDETFAVMERHFWSGEYGRYACEADAHWKVRPYRGQNDNMHACEALVAAYEATGETAFLDRACALAAAMAGRASTGLTRGFVWEHYTENWSPDFEYNRGDTKSDPRRPWGVQTGHQTEWAKLLLILERHRPEAWRLERARELFDAAMKYGWDREHGGLIYGFELSGEPCDQDKYFWVQAESIAAAALLADRTGDAVYWDWYDRLWDYSFRYFVDHRHGAWYRILSRENVRYDERKSYNNKADYHTMGACYEVLKLIPAGGA
jgi:mannose/cellobiose epimerase-like protein (N-acyl-D-glucosamine 2-epimerase family)